jgi:predicted enzyme related to lactoylglutathione lyase
MANNLSAFAINADDVQRARRFYEKVLGWRFEPWGPPNFYLIDTGDKKDPGVTGLLQERRELVKGVRMVGFECTITVGDLDKTIRAIIANGGKLATSKAAIPTVGTVVYFNDPEGNVIGAIEPERAK